jgi:restriction system protein
MKNCQTISFSGSACLDQLSFASKSNGSARSPARKGAYISAIPSKTPSATPLDQHRVADSRELKAELLDRLKAEIPTIFERIVIELLVKMGYGGNRADAAQAIGKSGDEGLDGVIKEDRLGLDIIYVQAKRWAATIGRPEIQKFAGALHGQHATKGIFITTSDFSRDANDYVSKIESKIVLIDGSKLAELIIEFGVAVATDATYTVKRIDNDFFESI